MINKYSEEKKKYHVFLIWKIKRIYNFFFFFKSAVRVGTTDKNIIQEIRIWRWLSWYIWQFLEIYVEIPNILFIFSSTQKLGWKKK